MGGQSSAECSVFVMVRSLPVQVETQIKGMIHLQKNENLSSCTRPHAASDLYDVFFCRIQRERELNEYLLVGFQFVHLYIILTCADKHQHELI